MNVKSKLCEYLKHSLEIKASVSLNVLVPNTVRFLCLSTKAWCSAALIYCLSPVVFQLADWVYGSTGKPECGCFGVYDMEVGVEGWRGGLCRL